MSLKYLVVFFFLLMIYNGSAKKLSNGLKMESLPLIDSSALQVKNPDSLIEKKVFSDEKLHYNLNIKYEPGIVQRFINWLTHLIFGNNSYENIYLTRQIILWTMIIGAITVVIRLLMKSNLSRLVKPESKLTTFNFNEITEDLNTINFDKMIAEAFQKKDYRLAIRWHYLKALFILEKGKFLIFEPSKTNIDYKNDLRKTHFQKEFMGLSKIYDYVWYGKFEVDQLKYSDFKNEFKSFESIINVQE